MRHALHILALLTVLVAFAAATPNIFSSFNAPFLNSFFGLSNTTAQELRRRQDSSACPSGYGNNCAGLGNAALCCPDNAICSADYAGNVACCPVGAACTGSITSTTTAAGSASTTTDAGGIGGIVGASSASTTTATTSFIFASSVATSSTTDSAASTETASGGGVIITAGGSSGAVGTASTVDNPYFPIAIIPATYANADACSSAYSTCQSDIASGTAVLQGASSSDVGGAWGGNGGITIDAPNGGTTIVPVTTSYPSASASAICASISTRACGTFSVQQCSRFGSGGAAAMATSSGGVGDSKGLGGTIYMIMVAVVMVAV